MFSSKESRVSALKVRSLIHFELIFVYGVGEGYDFLYCSGDSCGKNTGVACHSLLQALCFVRTLLCDLSVLGGPP